MKTVLPWILVLGLSVALAAVFVSSHAKDLELAKLRAESQQTQNLRSELEQAKSQSESQRSEIARLRQDNGDLLRLRSEVSRLRDENQQLSKQSQTAQTEAQRAQEQAAQALRLGAQKQQQLQRENQLLRTTVQRADSQTQKNTCINNLRMLEAAKQQWALENGKPANAVPSPQDIEPYLPGNKMPVCPSGGRYSLNAVNQPPTCSIPGHVLPQ